MENKWYMAGSKNLSSKTQIKFNTYKNKYNIVPF